MREIPIDARCLRCGFRLSWIVVLGNQAFLRLASSVVLFLAFSAIGYSQNVTKSQIVIEVRKKEIARLGLDKLYLDVKLGLKNAGTVPAIIDKIVISSGKTKSESSLGLFGWPLDPGKKTGFSSRLFGPLERQIGSSQIRATISAIDEAGKVIGEKAISISIPTVGIGDTIPKTGQIHGMRDLSLTPISWTESNINVVLMSSPGDYYTYSARPGKKFIILFFIIKNNWIRPQRSYVGSHNAEVATDKGYIYPGFRIVGRQRRRSTENEIEALACPFKELLPGESSRDCFVFEIPEVERPVEAIHPCMPPIVKFNKAPVLPRGHVAKLRAERRPSSKRRRELKAGIYRVRYPTTVHSEPREDSSTVAEIRKDTRVNVVGVEGDWLEIRSKHGRPPGFIKKVSVMPRKGR